MVLTLDVLFFDVEGSNLCGYDHLDVHDGDHVGAQKFGSYCNDFLPPDSMQVLELYFMLCMCLLGNILVRCAY